MDRIRGLVRQLRAVFRREQVERELTEELSFHVAMEEAANREAGLSETEARRRARVAFGGVDRYAERVREARWTRWLDDAAADIRYAVRGVGRRPGFTLAVVLTLGLGIGGTTSIFSVVDGLYLRAPEGVVAAGEVRRLYIARDEGNIQTPGGGAGSWVDYTALRGATPLLAGVAAYQAQSVDLGRGAEADRLSVVLVSPEYFGLLGVRAVLGRLFAADEYEAPQPVAVISHEFWQTRFGGEPDALGSVLVLNGEAVEVVGVLQRGFTGLEATASDAWLPAVMGVPLGVIFSGPDFDWRTNPGMAAFQYVARLAPGAEEATARQQAEAALRHAAEAHPDMDPTPELVATTLVPAATPHGSKAADLSLWLALVAGLVLIIACANVANLLLARSIARRRELAVRLSLGAGRWRVARQHLTESLVLALLGGAAGVLLAYWGMSLVQQFPLPPSAGRFDARLLTFAFGIALLTGLLFGVLPALRAVQLDPLVGLKDSRAIGSLSRNRTRRALVVVQVALSLVLLVGAGLFVRSLRAVNRIDGGVDVERLLMVRADLRRAGFTDEERETFYEQALVRLRGLPGIASAAIVHFEPYTGMAMGVGWQLPGRETPVDTDGPYLNMAGVGYFETAGTRVLAGRAFGPEDRMGSPPVAVVNEAMARLIAAHGNAVGECIAIRAQVREGGCTQVIGIVETQRRSYLREAASPMIFLSRAQAPNAITWGGPTLVARTSGHPEAHAATVRDALHGVRPDLPFIQVQPLAENIRREVLPFRLGATLFSLFGLLALALAAIGLYGVLGYFVSERTHEIGIRRSLGAPISNVVRLVMRQGLAPVLVGVAIGLGVAWAGTRFLASLLFGVEARDPAAFAGATVFLIAVALAATLLPARRAARVDPLVALRDD